jgi:hypothetical protein
MFEKYPQILVAIIAFSGVILGLFWNQFFAWRRHKREQKAKLNHLLFNLLELYFFFSKNNFAGHIKLYLSKMEEKLGQIPPNEKLQVEAYILGIVKQRFDEISGDEIDKLSENYESAVNEVAQINPFLAYRLSGQSKKMENLDAFHNYLDSFHELITNNTDKQVLEGIKAQFSDEDFVKEAIEDIKDSILEVSQVISFLKHQEAKNFFKVQEVRLKKELDKEIGEVVDKIVDLIKQHSGL